MASAMFYAIDSILAAKMSMTSLLKYLIDPSMIASLGKTLSVVPAFIWQIVNTQFSRLSILRDLIV